MRAYIDADILIWHLRGNEKARNFLEKIYQKKEYELWTGALQRAEIVFFMRESEKKQTLSFLSHFNCAAVNDKIIDLAAEFYRFWQPKHGTDINDAVLAATVQLSGGKIFTLNLKHYPMPNIVVEKPF